jgi:hypothetical protein
MSGFTELTVISFLAFAAVYVLLRVSEAADASSGEIVTGVVRGTPVSAGFREGLLFAVWLPYQVSMVVLTAFLALAMREMADHVSGANIRLLAHLAAFLAGSMSGLILMSASFGFFRFRAKLRRVRQRKAEAD